MTRRVGQQDMLARRDGGQPGVLAGLVILMLSCSCQGTDQPVVRAKAAGQPVSQNGRLSFVDLSGLVVRSYT